MKKIKDIFFLVLIFFISFLAIEALLRGAYEVRGVFRTVINSDFYRNVFKNGKESPTLYKKPILQYSSYLGYIPKKNFSDTGYHINQYHLRYNDNFPKAKDENEIRIFVTGGSTAFGEGVPQSNTYAYVLEKLLRAQYPKLKIRVIIAAAGAYVTSQERIFFENIVLPLNPDIIMMFSGWNDTYFGYRGTNIMHEQDYWGIKKVLLGQFKNTPKKRLRVEESDINNFVNPPLYEDYISKIFLFYDKFLYARKFPNKAAMQTAISEISIEPKSVYSSLKHNIRIIKTICDSIGSKFIFYLQPTIFATEKKKLTKYEQTVMKSYSEAYVGFSDYNHNIYQIYRKLLPIDARNNGYAFVNGDEAFKSEEKTAFTDEVHFNDSGNRLLAEHMFKTLNPLINEMADKKKTATLAKL
jgi:hypothetical protein